MKTQLRVFQVGAILCPIIVAAIIGWSLDPGDTTTGQWVGLALVFLLGAMAGVLWAVVDVALDRYRPGGEHPRRRA